MKPTKRTKATPGGVAPKSLLSRGAPAPGEPPPGPPWFKDQGKLLAAVVELARADPAFAGKVADAVGALARAQPGLRKKLHTSAKGGRRGAPARRVALLAMVADTYIAFAKRRPRGARAECIRWVVEHASALGVPTVTTDRGAEGLVVAAIRRFPSGSMAHGKSQSV